MSYSRFALGFSRSRKITRLSDAAYRLWSSAIDYTREQLTDGFLDEKDLQVIPRGSSGAWKVSVVAELVNAGLWIRNGGGWQIREFLDWQDSAAQVKVQRDKARERMRAVRANKSRTSPEVPPTNPSLVLPPPSDSSGSDLEPGSTHGSGSPGACDLQTRANAWVENPNRASLTAPQPEKWAETEFLASVLAEVFGGPRQMPRHSSDPRMKALLALWAEGRTMVELEQAIRGAGKDQFYRENPQLQMLQTILKDSATVDKFIRLLTVAPAAPARRSKGALQPNHGKTGTENVRRL
jgi:hypothetical protein